MTNVLLEAIGFLPVDGFRHSEGGEQVGDRLIDRRVSRGLRGSPSPAPWRTVSD